MRDHLINKGTSAGTSWLWRLPDHTERMMYDSGPGLGCTLVVDGPRFTPYSARVQRGHIASAGSMSEPPIGMSTVLMTVLVSSSSPIRSVANLIAYQGPTPTSLGDV